MGYKSPYMRFGNTRYEKDIAKLRRYDYNLRYEAYEDAEKTLDEVLTMPDASQNYIDNVARHATDCALKLGPFWDDDAELVARHGKAMLGQEEYNWLKSEIAKKGEDVEGLSW
ncbi:MAG: hypothetical protein WCS18_12295 [Sphaerochaetaceae bacterium]